MASQAKSSQIFWAKTTHDAVNYPRAFHPLLCHMIDVASVTGELWRHVVSPAWRKRINDEFGSSRDETERIVSWLAGLHDLGKACPPFALRTDSLSARNLREMFVKTDFDMHIVPPAKDAPHGTVTTHALAKILQDEYGVSALLAKRLAALLGGHHGMFPLKRNIDAIADPRLGGNRAWTNARRDLTFALGELLDVPRPLTHLKTKELSDAATIFIAGLVSIADWIGSDTRFFVCEIKDANNAQPIDFSSYLAHAKKQACEALARLGWLATPNAHRTGVSFAQMFPHISDDPRPLQTEAIKIADALDAPGIAIIEAPTGEGKTEAAMTLADAWSQVTGGRGYYFALPTQATSDQMFSRVREFLRARYGDESITLQLLHGHAALSAEFSDLLKTGKSTLLPQETLRPGDVYADDVRTQDAAKHSSSKADARERGNVIAAEWFTYRKRGLLAAFGVGTIDQALLAALQTPHVFVRLFGLAGKVVVIDEVHAYDAYMSTLLERLLEWLAALGSPVVLLSATLPRERSKSLLNAYLKGSERKSSGDSDSGDEHQTGMSETSRDLTLAPYPRISWVTTRNADDGNDIAFASLPLETSSEAKRTLHLRAIDAFKTTGDEDFHASIHTLATHLQQALTYGGCAAIICNTVKRAQDIYEALQPFFPGKAFAADDGDDMPLLDLLHSRFTYDERLKRERRALKNFGKQGAVITYDDNTRATVKRPHLAILVATQIIEQSLDLDFDLMVTELAPVDLMLQRAGRLQRHHRTRPQGLEQPTLWIIKPNVDADGAPDFDRSKYVYDEHILLRSWLEVRARLAARAPLIEIPSEIETLIENVYTDERACPDKALQAVWESTRAEREQRLSDERREAQDRWLARPNAGIPLWRFTSSPREEDEPDFHPAHQALTRLTEPSVQVACLYGADPANAFFDSRQCERVNLNEVPPLAEAKRILFRSITISGYRAALPLMKMEVPRGWQKSALLRHHRILLLNAEGNAHVGNNIYRLDVRLGLIIKNAKGEPD